MTERLNIEGHGTPYPNPDEVPTEEFPAITPEMIAEHEAAEQPPSRLRRVGNFLLRGLEAMGRPYAGGYGAARSGAFYVPPRPPETKTDDSDDEEETTKGGW